MSRLDLRGTTEQTDRAYVATNPALKALVTKRPAQIEAWVDANITDLASAKELLKQLTLAVSILAKREFAEIEAGRA